MSTDSPKRCVRVAVVGAGYFAAFHYLGWRAHPRVALAAIVDRDMAKAAAAAAAHDVPHAFADLGAALAAVEIDLVDIAAPPPAHLELIDAASAAGLLVICQKPFCGGLVAAEKAAALAEARGVPLVVHENFRFQPWWRRIKAELDAGRLGELYDVAFRLRPGDGQGREAYLDRQPYFQTMPRFLVHETAVHLVDVFRYLMGEPEWVWADLRRLNPAIAGEDAGVIVLGFAGGRRAIFDGNRLADHVADNRRFVMGDAWLDGAAGSIALNGDGQAAFRPHGSNSAEPLDIPLRPDRFGGGCVDALQAHVIDHLLTGAPLENTARDYLKNLRIVEAVYASAETGAKVMLAAG